MVAEWGSGTGGAVCLDKSDNIVFYSTENITCTIPT